MSARDYGITGIRRPLYQPGTTVWWFNHTTHPFIRGSVIISIFASTATVTYRMADGSEVEERELGTSWDWANSGRQM